MQTGLIEILVMIALIPYVTVRAWLDKFNHLPPREAETARAAHGVAIALLFPLIMHWLIDMAGLDSSDTCCPTIGFPISATAGLPSSR